MQDGTVADQPFLDLRSRMVALNPGYDERGLLGMAFHPNYSQNGRFFVYYSAPLRSGGLTGWNHTSHISEFRVMAGNPDKADETSERVVLQVDEPQANHNGGQIRFGPDGYLYIPLGDGGGANDVGLGHSTIGNGQDINTFLGKILRIDVDGGQPYVIPPDNPFVGRDGADEIYALGLRNPFQISFDIDGTHQLFAGDAGQNLLEEVDIITKGGNYGWDIKEGKYCFNPNSPNQPPAQCSAVDARGNSLIDPIIAYGHSGSGITGTAVIGGFVYRGKAIPGLQGVYIFGDFSSPGSGGDGRLFAASLQSPSNQWDFKELGINTSNGRLGALLRSFGQDAEGEMYVLTAETGGPSGKTGKIYRIVP
jgi:glucose/arabinose dehydrogenase